MTLAGNKNTGRSVKETFPVLEMSCAACAVSVESALKATPGVHQAAVNFSNHSVLVDFDSKLREPAKLQKAVLSIGYDLVINVENPQEIQETIQRQPYREINTITLLSAV